jgi:hypothetical protein
MKRPYVQFIIRSESLSQPANPTLHDLGASYNRTATSLHDDLPDLVNSLDDAVDVSWRPTYMNQELTGVFCISVFICPLPENQLILTVSLTTDSGSHLHDKNL